MRRRIMAADMSASIMPIAPFLGLPADRILRPVRFASAFAAFIPAGVYEKFLDPTLGMP